MKDSRRILAHYPDYMIVEEVFNNHKSVMVYHVSVSAVCGTEENAHQIVKERCLCNLTVESPFPFKKKTIKRLEKLREKVSRYYRDGEEEVDLDQ
jgi:hypothetical protein